MDKYIADDWGWGTASNHVVFKAGWKHFVLVTNPSGSAPQEQVYLNGVLVGSLNSTAAFTYTAGGTNTFFGRNGNTSANYDFGGVIDEPRIEKVARSADWINLSSRISGSIRDSVRCPRPEPGPCLADKRNGKPGGEPLVFLGFGWPGRFPTIFRLRQVPISQVSCPTTGLDV